MTLCDLVTLCNLVTIFVETKSVTKSRLHCTSNMMPHDVNALVGDGYHSRKNYVSITQV